MKFEKSLKTLINYSRENPDERYIDLNKVNVPQNHIDEMVSRGLITSEKIDFSNSGLKLTPDAFAYKFKKHDKWFDFWIDKIVSFILGLISGIILDRLIIWLSH